MIHCGKLSRLVACLIAVLMMFALCSCSSTSSSSGSSSQSTDAVVDNAPVKYEYEGISVSSITAVVGDKAYYGSASDTGTTTTYTYNYEDLSASDINAYGEYLLQNGFEEVQTNVYSQTTQDGVTMKITLNSNSVVVAGSKK